jgi:hypothetical protein
MNIMHRSIVTASPLTGEALAPLAHPKESSVHESCAAGDHPPDCGAVVQEQQSAAATGTPPLDRGEALVYYERLIQESLVLEEQRGNALLAVYEQELYKPMHPSFRAYVGERWEISGSRAYQILHYARVSRACREQGKPVPANERAARLLSPDGTPVTRPPRSNSYEQLRRRMRRSLARHVAMLPPEEQRRFLQDTQECLDQLRKQLAVQPDPGTAPVETRTAGSDPVAGAASADTRTASSAREVATTSRPSAGLPADSSPVTPNRTSHPATGSAGAAAGPAPPVNTGSVVGLTMAEARRLGYVH